MIDSDKATTLKLLVDNNLVSANATIENLDGGVSSDVYFVHDDQKKLVVKSALAQLKTEATWLADTSRSVAEAEALKLHHTITPTHLPEVIAFLENKLVITAADDSWVDLRKYLLETQEINPEWFIDLVTDLAKTLAAWHNQTQDLNNLPIIFDNKERLKQLRTHPFHRFCAQIRPDLKEILLALADNLENNSNCLVHGDFSPKNVLASTEESNKYWVIDAEVAHLGLAVFDQTYFLTHLLLKATHKPEQRELFIRAAKTFNETYLNLVDPELKTDNWQNYLGAILLARVIGKSPATYLTQKEKITAEQIAKFLLTSQTSNIFDEIHSILLEVT
jgi:5-methylthioribose kinase